MYDTAHAMAHGEYLRFFRTVCEDCVFWCKIRNKAVRTGYVFGVGVGVGVSAGCTKRLGGWGWLMSIATLEFVATESPIDYVR